MKFGSPGSLKDVNILDSSSIIQKILEGEMIPGFSYEVNGNEINICYFNVNGIYPNWGIFVKQIDEAMDKKHRNFGAAQAGASKRCRVRVWSSNLSLEHFACIILHKMSVELRRGEYESELWSLARSDVGRQPIVDTEGN